jgi:CRP/FNR family cyclic AMP-dependent transcriptional regulator
MTSNRVYIDHLRRVNMFEQFSRKDLEKIARASDEVSVPAGSVILEQGSEGHEAYVVLSGTVVIRRNGRKVATLGPGAILGELSLLDHGQRTATATCETDCDLLVLTQGTFMSVVMEVPQLAHKLLATMVSRIRDLDKLSLH